MLVRIARRFTGSLVAMSLTLMALSVCASGPMTITEMVCCAEHHDECNMAGQRESCCGPDLQSDMGMLAPEHPDTVQAFPAASQIMIAVTDAADALSTVSNSARTDARDAAHHTRPQPHRLNTVLLI